MSDPSAPEEAGPLSEPHAIANSTADLGSFDEEETAFERFGYWLEGQQWVAVVAFAAGLVLLFVAGPFVGLATVSAAVVLAGLVPIITGRYRGPFGTLHGTRARMRGLVSVVFGLIILSFAMAL